MAVKGRIQAGLGRFGRRLRRAPERPLGVALERVVTPWDQISRLPQPATLIDVGVNRGTPELYRFFPAAHLVLIDPLPESRAFVAANPRAAGVAGRSYEFLPAALGARPERRTLTVEHIDLGRSSLCARSEITRTGGAQETRSVELQTLDALHASHAWPGPFGLKIDTEGFELPILQGARGLLAETAFVLVEMSIVPRFEDSYRAEELIGFLASEGFGLSYLLSAAMHDDGLVRFVDVAFERRG